MNSRPAKADPIERLFPFVMLCLALGPAVGFATFIGFTWFTAPALFSPLDAFRNGTFWLGAYLIGGSYAILSVIVFMFIELLFKRSGFDVALIAAVIPPLVFCLNSSLNDMSISRHPSGNLRGLLMFMFIGVVAMSVCWFVARALKLLR